MIYGFAVSQEVYQNMLQPKTCSSADTKISVRNSMIGIKRDDTISLDLLSLFRVLICWCLGLFLFSISVH